MRALATLAFLALAAVAAAADAPWLCRPATPGARSHGRDLQAAISDRFGARTAPLARPDTYCTPAVSGAEAGTGTFVGYAVRAGGGTAARRAARRLDATVTTRLGTVALRLRRLDHVLAPATAGRAAADGTRACYLARGASPAPSGVRVVVTDADAGERVVELHRPTRLCVASGGSPGADAVCYRARLLDAAATSRRSRGLRGKVVATTSYGTERLRLGRAVELCLPARTVAAGTPPTLALDPPSARIDAGTRQVYRVTAHFADGRLDEDWSARVDLRSSDETVALGTASTAGAFVEGVGPGTARITAVDRATGATSTPDGDATVEVTWDLVRITLDPPATTRAPGAVESFTATGHFADGHVRNLTQRVTWTSSDPTVALAPNEPGRRSRVVAVSRGTATITATDPISGLATAASGDDATLRVAGGLLWVQVQQEGPFAPSRFPGEPIRFTAIGHFADGTSRNVTQRVRWSTDDPDVAVAPNDPGDASRVDARAVGHTWVSCEDPETGVACYGTPLYVNGALESVSIAWGDTFPPMRLDEVRRFTAIGQYQGGGLRNLTQEVDWSTLDPALVEVPNPAGDRSRVVARSGGQARLVVVEPQSGVASDPLSVVVLGPLTGLRLRARYLTPGRIGVGTTFTGFIVSAIYDGLAADYPFTLDLSRFEPASYVLESSAPQHVAVTADAHGVQGIAPGPASITARHLATGLVSQPVPLTATGPLARLRLTPTAVTRGVGEQEEFTAFGFHEPDLEELVTQRLVYTSSDPAVVVVEDTPGRRSRIRTAGPGTAVISATDPVTGISTHDSGGDATVTVLPGTLSRIEITPAVRSLVVGNDFEFTAIGHYADGRTINVTQQVTWYVQEAGVAEASNPQSARSRIHALTPGTAHVGARHPSGVDTADTGDGARLDVLGVASIVPPPTVITKVGLVFRLPAQHGVLTDGSTAKLREYTDYFVDFGPDVVVQASWDENHQLMVQALTAGTTTYAVVLADGRRATGTLVVRGGGGSPSGAFVGP